MRIGVDLGGTKIEVIALDPRGEALLRERRPTPRGDYAATLRQITDLVALAEQRTGERGSVGVGIPGTLSPVSGLVKNANSTWLNGQDLLSDLEAQLDRQVRVANDANCFAVSEATDGAARGAGVVFGVILGTGTGGGVAVEGRVHAGRNGVAGEWGHNPLPFPSPEEYQEAPDCYCGRRGCIETYLSGPGFAARHRHLTGQDLTAPEIMVRVRGGDEPSRRAFGRYRDQLARSLAHVVGVLDPDVVVLGGGMSNLPELYPGLTEAVAGWTFGGECTTPILEARHGDSSGVRGAAWLW